MHMLVSQYLNSKKSEHEIAQTANWWNCIILYQNLANYSLIFNSTLLRGLCFLFFWDLKKFANVVYRVWMSCLWIHISVSRKINSSGLKFHDTSGCCTKFWPYMYLQIYKCTCCQDYSKNKSKNALDVKTLDHEVKEAKFSFCL